MARISGKDGAVTIAGTGTISFRRWSINYVTRAVNTTAFTDVATARAIGIKDWTFSAEGTLDGATAAAMPTAAQTCTFTQAASRTWIGSAIITSLTPDVDIEGAASVVVTGEGNGDLTLA